MQNRECDGAGRARLRGEWSYSLFVGARSPRRSFLRKDVRVMGEITARHFPSGFSLIDVAGSWYDPRTGTLRKEESRQIIVRSKSLRKVRAWAKELGRALGQKELLVTELGRSEVIPAQPAAGSMRHS